MRSIGIILKSDAFARVITAAPFMTVINRDLPCIQRNTDRKSLLMCDKEVVEV